MRSAVRCGAVFVMTEPQRESAAGERECICVAAVGQRTAVAALLLRAAVIEPMASRCGGTGRRLRGER